MALLESMQALSSNPWVGRNFLRKRKGNAHIVNRSSILLKELPMEIVELLNKGMCTTININPIFCLFCYWSNMNVAIHSMHRIPSCVPITVQFMLLRLSWALWEPNLRVLIARNRWDRSVSFLRWGKPTQPMNLESNDMVFTGNW